ncbi:MAG: hypothetical protein KGV59_05475 [Tenacibaculum sp.]|nr:hypothetical protein [Tenacibaculum sp.]
MIKLTQNTRVGGDETTGYSVELTKEYTVKKFVDEVVSNEGEWGSIIVNNDYSSVCKYKWGKLLSELPLDVLDKKVVSATASGGWSRMDYLLTVE